MSSLDDQHKTLQTELVYCIAVTLVWLGGRVLLQQRRHQLFLWKPRRRGAGDAPGVITWRCSPGEDDRVPLVSPDHHPIRHQDTHTSIPSPAARRRRKSGHREGKKCAQGNTARERPGSDSQAVLAVEPGGVPIAVQPPVPLLPPSGLPPCSGPPPQSRVLGWLCTREAFQSWLRCWQPCPLAHPGLPYYTIYNMHRSQVSEVPNPNILVLRNRL